MKTAILLTFDSQATGTIDRIFDAILKALAKFGIAPEVSVKEYSGEYDGPVIYFP